MHEQSITEGILRVATEHAERAGAQRIAHIHIVVGELSNVSEDSVRFYFELLSQNTIAEKAALHFQRVRARFRCRDCGQEFEPEGLDWNCPHCQALGGDIVAGREFYVESIEVE
jgi:hydrogenase nickel incorporation protein HypA/HybF